MSERTIDITARREAAAAQQEIDQTCFVIRTNNCITNYQCAICGARTDPSGVDLMTTDNALVCVPCGRKHAPRLQGLLDLATAAHVYAGRELREAFGFGDEPF